MPLDDIAPHGSTCCCDPCRGERHDRRRANETTEQRMQADAWEQGFLLVFRDGWRAM